MSANDTPRSSSLLFDQQILVLRVRLATVLTLPKAVAFQQLRFCSYANGKGKNRDVLHDERGRVWIGRTVTEWRLSSFPFWCNDTIADTFAALVKDGYVLEETFPEGGKGRTKWYAIADDALTRLDYLAMAQYLRRPAPAARAGRRDERAAELAATPLPRDELFIDSETLFIIPKLAKEIGLNEAIVLQQVYYWLDDKRKPEVRDGERWIYNTYADWQEQFPFFSTRTVQRTFLSLQQKGLLKSAHFSRHPDSGGVDHTKWYTIDFVAVRALRTAQESGRRAGVARREAADHARMTNVPAPLEANVPTLPMRMCQIPELEIPSDGASSPIRNVPGFRIEGATSPPALAPDLRREGATFPASHLIETKEITKENTETKQEQQRLGEPALAGEHLEGPVVVVPNPTILSEWLFARGVTRTVAERLAREVPAATVMRQVEVYDWLREADEDDERLTPGRLRLMIEEDWVPPRDFIATAERARRAAAARETDAARLWEQAVAADRARARQEAAAAERQGVLDALGLLAEDQRVWAVIATSPRRLPSIFVDALFYPPRGAPDHTPPAIILRDREARERASSAHYAAERREIERRLIGRYPVLAARSRDAVLYLAYDDLLAMRQSAEASTASTGGDPTTCPAR